jgi:small subunit ribosomal protein S8e
MNKGRKNSGGKYHANRKKKHYEKRSQEKTTFLGETRKKKIRERNGSIRTTLARANIVNIITKSGTKKAEITNVLETPQNTFLARQNRLMKGVIIQTSAGKAKITNRPSREGNINAILLEN